MSTDQREKIREILRRTSPGLLQWADAVKKTFSGARMTHLDVAGHKPMGSDPGTWTARDERLRRLQMLNAKQGRKK